MATWTETDIDNAYNYASLLGGLVFLGWDQVAPFNKTKGFLGASLIFFAGVGVGGTAAYGYLYSQGIYDPKLYKRFNIAVGDRSTEPVWKRQSASTAN